MKKMIVLISGRGSNMCALAQACASEGWPARIAAVISNRPGVEGLARAAALGLPGRVVDYREHGTRAGFDAALAHAIDAEAPDLVVLAGFMRILTEGFVRRYEGRLLNIHPSLLPMFPGVDTHRRALAAGVRVHGATVHFVGTELDAGPIVAQAVVAVRDDDTEQALAARVLELEHRLYPTAVRWFVEDRLRIEGARVRLMPGPAGSAPESRLLGAVA